MIDGLSQTWIIVTATLVLMLCLLFGTILIRRGKEEEDRKERNRERHRNKVKNGR